MTLRHEDDHWSLEAGGSCGGRGLGLGVKPKADFTHVIPVDWCYLQNHFYFTDLLGRKNLLPGWNGQGDSLPQQGHLQTTGVAAIWKQVLLQPSWALWQPDSNPVFLGWPLGWTQQDAPTGETEGVGPKSGSGKVGHGMSEVGLWVILKVESWNCIMPNFKSIFF